MTKEIQRTVGDAALGHLDDLEDGDLARGYFNAAPKGNYEGELVDSPFGSRGTRHAGHIEADGFKAEHGTHDEYGFVRRPTMKHDVERN